MLFLVDFVLGSDTTIKSTTNDPEDIIVVLNIQNHSKEIGQISGFGTEPLHFGPE